jgi:eukaryotic-like serine/threonine-protein kinase
MAETGLEGRALGGRYRLRSLLAVGGMGAVWAAEDAVLGREVAVKVLGEALAADRRAALRLQREARAAGRLEHPGIARVLDLGEDAGRPYLVMELLHGESLAARLARAGPLAPAEAVRVVAAAADALEVAHRAGIVHRDVKPGNVYLTGGGDVKLLDFGIASAANEAALTGGDLLGTAAYLAPERVLGHDATPAADVYALGVLLYELLAGRPPFVGDTRTALAMAHLHARPAPLGAVAPRVPPALAAACERALAKDPAARPPSAAALAALLRSTVAPGPVPRPLVPAGPAAPAEVGTPTPVHPPALVPPPAPVLGAATPAHPPAPLHRPAASGAPRTRGAAARVRRRRGAWVAAALLLAALLAAVPAFGTLPLGGRKPAGPGVQAPVGGSAPTSGQAPAGGRASTDGQAPAGGGLGAAGPGRQETPGGVVNRPGHDPGDEDGGDGGEGSGGDDDGSGGEGSGGGGGSSGPG